LENDDIIYFMANSKLVQTFYGVPALLTPAGIHSGVRLTITNPVSIMGSSYGNATIAIGGPDIVDGAGEIDIFKCYFLESGKTITLDVPNGNDAIYATSTTSADSVLVEVLTVNFS
jgi:hypothetical protein